MNNLRNRFALFAVIGMAAVMGALHFTSDTAHACYEDMWGNQWGFGCDGDPLFVSDWVKDRWDELGEAPESALRICSEVGVEKCGDFNFIQTYQLLRAGQMSDMFNDVQSCVAAGYTFSEGGHQAAQYIALANGVPLPDEFMQISQNYTEGNVVDACQVLFGRAYTPGSLAYLGEGVYARPEDASAIREEINEQDERESIRAGTTNTTALVPSSNSQGSVMLSSGFLPGPYQRAVTASASRAASSISSSCTGYIGAQPTFQLNWSESSSQFPIFVTSSSDTTLLAKDPSGRFHCNDDWTSGDIDPMVRFNNPTPGIYSIWVGKYESGGSANGQLHISEYTDRNPANPN